MIHFKKGKKQRHSTHCQKNQTTACLGNVENMFPASPNNQFQKEATPSQTSMSDDPFYTPLHCYLKKSFSTEACGDQDALNRLASSLVRAPYS